MGNYLLPKHPNSQEVGWISGIDFENKILKNLKVRYVESGFGKWGQEFINIDREHKDKYSIGYSIPNPWSNVYLFEQVLFDDKTKDNKKFRTFLFENLLSLLRDLRGKDIPEDRHLRIKRVGEPKTKSFFHKFWHMAPDSIKFNNDIYLLINKDDNIIGGFSKKCLIWAFYPYQKADIPLNELKEEMFDYLKFIKYRTGNKYNGLWDSPEIDMDRRVNENPLNESDYPPYDEVSGVPGLEWVLRYEKGYYTNKERIEKIGYINDNFVENDWLQLNQIDLSDEDLKSYVRTYHNTQYLFPINDAGLKQFDINDEERFENNLVEQAINEKIGNISEIDSKSTEEKNIDKRSFAIWPPFPSREMENYIMEFSNDKFEEGASLEFYDEHFELLEVESTEISELLPTTTKNKSSGYFRLNKILKKDAFPHFIKVIKNPNTKGILKVVPRVKKNKAAIPDNIVVGVDFGSSHTTVSYSIGDNDQIMNFTNSQPIVIAGTEFIQSKLLLCFITNNLLSEAPVKKEKYDRTKAWVPFRTVWKDFIDWKNNDKTNSNAKFLKYGTIPLYFEPEFALLHPDFTKVNIKWTGNQDLLYGFLTHLLHMIRVEAEAIGYQNSLIIRWAYPQAALHSRSLVYMISFYNWYKTEYLTDRNDIQFNDTIGENSEKIYSESVCVKRYFINKMKNAGIGVMCIVDIGGGTSDLAFILRADEIAWEDSFKFAGSDLVNVLNGVYRKLMNMANENEKFTVPLSPEKQHPEYEELLRTWPAVHPSWDTKMLDLKKEEGKSLEPWLHEKISLFYAGICYYAGLHMKNKKDKEISDENDKNKMLKEIKDFKLVFAGNGSQFVRLMNGGIITDTDFIQFLKGITSDVLDNKMDVHIEFSNQNIKKEVAYGLLYLNHMEDHGHTTYESLFGIDIGKHSWDKHIDDVKYNDVNFSDIKFDEESNFRNFLVSFYTMAKMKSENAKFFQDRIHSLGKDKEEIREKIDNYLTKSSNNIDFKNKFAAIFANYKEKDNSDYLIVPPFFMALKTWIELVERL